jgi:hypothetical protein
VNSEVHVSGEPDGMDALGLFSYGSLLLCFAILMDYGLLSHIDSRELSLVHHVFRAKVATLFIGLNALVTRPYIFY